MTTIFSDGFESGDFSAWTATENSPTIVASPVHHGSYAMQANLGSWAGANCRANKTITSTSTVYTRCYVRMNDLFTGSGQKAIGPRYYYGGGAIAYALIDCINGKWGIQNAVNSTSYYESGASTINPDQWYCLELYILVNSTTGQLKLWVDGTLKVDQTGINTGSNNVTGVSINAYSQNAEGTTRTIYFDCAVIADTYIGVEGGGSSDLTVTGNLTVNGSTTLGGQLTTDSAIRNNGNYYYTIDRDGSTQILVIGVENTYPNTDFHFIPNYSTQSGGTSKVYFGYNSNWGSYNWMNGTTTLMSLNSSGTLTSKNNTLDDGSGNMTLNVWGSRLTFYDQYGHAGSIRAENSSPTYPWPYLHIQYGILADDITAKGFLATTSEGLEGNIGGGAIMMGHGFTQSGDPPLISLLDSGYDTLEIKGRNASEHASDWPYANMALNTLFAHGVVNILGSSPALNLADSGGYVLKASISYDGTNAIIYSNADLVLQASSNNVRPFANNTCSLGNQSFKWKDIYAVSTHFGDAVFANGWRLTEDKEDGVLLVRPDGSVAQRWS